MNHHVFNEGPEGHWCVSGWTAEQIKATLTQIFCSYSLKTRMMEFKIQSHIVYLRAHPPPHPPENLFQMTEIMLHLRSRFMHPSVCKLVTEWSRITVQTGMTGNRPHSCTQKAPSVSLLDKYSGGAWTEHAPVLDPFLRMEGTLTDRGDKAAGAASELPWV